MDPTAAGRNWAALPEEHRAQQRRESETVPWPRTSFAAAAVASDAADAASCNAEECGLEDADLQRSWVRPDPMVAEDLYYPDP